MNIYLLSTVSTVFLLLGLHNLVGYVRQRAPARRETAWLFGTLAIATATLLKGTLFAQNRLVWLLGSLALLAEPYLLLRILAVLRRISPGVRIAAAATGIVSWLTLIVLPQPPVSVTRAFMAIYVIMVNSYAGLLSLHGAGSNHGLARSRLRVAAFGSALFAVMIVFAGVGMLLSPDTALLPNAALCAAALAALALQAAGAPPRRLWNAWQNREMRLFLTRLAGFKEGAGIETLFHALGQAARKMTGAYAVTLFTRDTQSGWHRTHGESASPEPDTHLHLDSRHPVHFQHSSGESAPSAHGKGAANWIYSIPIHVSNNPQHAMLCYLGHRPLFPENDLEILEMCTFHTAVLLRNNDLADSLSEETSRLDATVKRQTAELKRLAAEAEILYKISDAANHSVSIDQPLQRAVDLICRALDFPLGHVFAPSGDAPDTITTTRLWSVRDQTSYAVFRAATEEIPFSTRLGGVDRAMADGAPVWLEDVGHRSDFVRADAARRSGIRTAVFVPVLVQHEVAAILELFSPEDRKKSAARMEFLKEVGTLLGRAVERMRAEARIETSEKRFRNTFELAAAGVAHISTSGHFLRINSTFGEIVGYSSDELRELTFQQITHPDDLQVDLEHLQMLQNDEIPSYTIEKRYVRKNGSAVWTDLTVSSVKGHTGEPGYLIAVIQDITMRKEMEMRLRRLAEELEKRVAERTRHLETLNQELEAFSYSVSHDLRAPLRSIDGFSTALVEDYATVLDSTALDYLNRVRSESRRMGTLIHDLLSLSRVTRERLRPEHVDLGQIAADVVKRLREREHERTVEVHIEEALYICADRNLTGILLDNLIGNAWKFTGNKKRARIAIGAAHVDGATEYYVRDNGEGFNMKHADRLFGAFQRLHSEDEFEGTGIGLATARRIVNLHGGSIRAEGAEGTGATFYFSLGLAGCE